MPLKSRGLLTISFTKTPSHIVCQINDNGIGREKAAELKKNIRNTNQPVWRTLGNELIFLTE
jgi:hypothetical protein